MHYLLTWLKVLNLQQNTLMSLLHVLVFNDHQGAYMYLIKVIFMLKHSVKLRRYVN